MNLEPGTRIRVKPVVFYPRGVAQDAVWHQRWQTAHATAREKYRRMLDERDTFELSPLLVVKGELGASTYKSRCFLPRGLVSPEQLGSSEACSEGVETILAEILAKPFDGERPYTRYTLPYCLSVLMVDPGQAWGAGGGRVLNGEADLGGGVHVIPSWHWDQGKLVSTLVHELGHTFGLVHVWDRIPADSRLAETSLFSCWYAQYASPSIMSYRIANQTNETDPAEVPGCLLGDEIHALASNRHVFPALTFRGTRDFDCPPPTAGCPPHDKKVRQAWMGPMDLVWCTSGFESGIDGGVASRLNDNPSRWILGSHPGIGFVGEHMWHSSTANEAGWVSIDVTFPMAIRMNRVIVYTEHSGDTHRAHALNVEHEVGPGTYQQDVQVAMPERDADVSFPASKATRWRIAFRAGPSAMVVVRGMRFFLDDDEWFPPLGPHAKTDYGETYGSRVTNLVELQRVIRANGPSVGFDPRSMWHSGPVDELGWVSLVVVFPTEVTLDRIRVYSQHSGAYHRAKRVQVEVADASGSYAFVAARTLSKPNGDVSFPDRSGKAWKLAFRGDEYVVVRGLRFLVDDAEFYPPGKIA